MNQFLPKARVCEDSHSPGGASSKTTVQMTLHPHESFQKKLPCPMDPVDHCVPSRDAFRGLQKKDSLENSYIRQNYCLRRILQGKFSISLAITTQDMSSDIFSS